MQAVLEIKGVTKEYSTEGGKVRALDNFSLRVGRGTFVALVGRSGCGKSTLLNLAGAMDFPTSGEVRIEGASTTGLGEQQLTALRRSKIGFIFQSFQLLRTLSVVENVELPLLLSGVGAARARALERLESVGLAELAGRMPYQLSGGQMQRVAIARALVHSPALLLADEPTGNLDTTTGNAILALLHSLVRTEQATLLMATHSAEAAAIADCVIHLRDGRMDGTAAAKD